MPLRDDRKKAADAERCKMAWALVMQNPDTTNRAAAIKVGISPGLFAKWISIYHYGEKHTIRAKLGLPLNPKSAAKPDILQVENIPPKND